jgi:hypothetical protein
LITITGVRDQPAGQDDRVSGFGDRVGWFSRPATSTFSRH